MRGKVNNTVIDRFGVPLVLFLTGILLLGAGAKTVPVSSAHPVPFRERLLENTPSPQPVLKFASSREPASRTISPAFRATFSPRAATGPASKTGLFSSPVTSGTIHEEWIRQFASQLMPATDLANAMVSDQRGNVAVTGTCNTLFSSYDFLTVRYLPSGDTAWVRKYNGPANGVDEATAVVMDADGNVYVAGYSPGLSGGDDIVLIGYASDGTQLWVSRFDGPAHGDDIPISLALSPSGFLFCAGYSVDSSLNYNTVLLCFDTSGEFHWSDQYDGPEHGTDIPTGLALTPSGIVAAVGYSADARGGFDYLVVADAADGRRVWSDRFHLPSDSTGIATAVTTDAAGGVVVTGFRNSQSSRNDFVTVCYDTAGVRRWTAVYNGPDNSNDQAYAIALNPKGGVVVTGTGNGKATGSDFVTVRYDDAGNQMWVSRFDDVNHGSDDPAAVTVDHLGDVYVAGSSMLSSLGSSDIAVVKIGSSGDFLWLKPYDGPAGGNDAPVGIALDARLRVITAGSTLASDGSSDFVVLRYDQFPPAAGLKALQQTVSAAGIDDGGNVILAGTEGTIWTVTSYDFNGTLRWRNSFGPEGSLPVALTVYPDRSIAVAGTVPSFTGRTLFGTVKYDRNGALQWSVIEDDTLAGRPAGLRPAADGGLYVSGTTHGNAGTDILTIRYSASGGKLWGSRYDGASQLWDSCAALCSDPAGNPVVVGTSSTGGNHSRIVLLLYDSTGVLRRESSSGDTSNSREAACAAVIDSRGRISITGYSGSGDTSRLLLLRFAGSGEFQWADRFSGPGTGPTSGYCLSGGDDGSVTVAGVTTGNSGPSWAVIKDDAAGTRLWTRLADMHDGSRSIPVGISPDESGNIYVTGSNLSFLKYSPEGTLADEDRSDAAGSISGVIAAADPHGLLYAAGNMKPGSGIPRAVLWQRSFDIHSPQKWPQRFSSGRISLDFASAAAADAAGNLYVAGTVSDPVNSADYLLVKYSPAGDMVWNETYNDASSNYNDVSAMSIDRSGNIDLTGLTSSLYVSPVITTVKYSPFGILQWFNDFGSPDAAYLTPTALAVNASSALAICGYLYADGIYDYLTFVYSAGGELLWSSRFGSQLAGIDVASAVTADSRTNTTVTGYSYGTGTQADVLTMSYNASGAVRWSRRFDGPRSGDDRGVAVVTTRGDHVVVGGWTTGPDTTSDFLILSYDSSGNSDWAVRVSAGLHSTDRLSGLITDSSGYIIATGTTVAAGASTADYFTVKLDVSGNLLWTRVYAGPAGGDDVPRADACDRNGNIVVTGKSMGDDLTGDYATVCYAPDGSELWSARYSAADHSDDEPAALAVSPDGGIIVTGTSQGPGWSIISTVKYPARGTDGITEPVTRPLWGLSAPQPNPFNPVTSIAFHCARRVRVTITVYDLLGRVAGELFNGLEDAGSFHVEWNAGGFASGMYIARMRASDPLTGAAVFTSSQKLLLLK